MSSATVMPTIMASPPIALECRDLRAGYEKLIVVRNVDLAVGPGEILAVLGPNGAGKSTLLSTLAGILPPISGEILLLGRPLPRGAPHRVCQLGAALVPEERALFPSLTVAEHNKVDRPRDSTALERVLDLFPALAPKRRLAAGLLSGGEQQMLALARALVLEPSVLLIDEMSMGLAPIIVEQLLPILRRVADDDRVAVILVEQHSKLALEVADRAALLVRGEFVAKGPATEMAAKSDVIRDAYLSGSLSHDRDRS